MGRLDAAITKARAAVFNAFSAAYHAPNEAVAHGNGRAEHFIGLFDKHAALVALRARYEERGRGMIHDLRGFADLDAEAERLLEDA